MTLATALRLDIGSSHLRVRPDYTTVDLYAPEADVRADMGALPFDDGSVEEIWASHCLEHVGPERTVPVLREWLRVLRPGGPAIVMVPNADYAARYWLHGPDRAMARQMIYGHQAEQGETHLTAWNAEMLRADLTEAGFDIVSLTSVFEDADHTQGGSYFHTMESLRAEVRKP